ncbi:unnamed protein product [Thlaspi arvense]|uniref:RBR-type E3 ubiquitin transferase n=1 Tax=Thlaspi arvense TaxID=13288 RepID=A0AAU9SLL4_THLAR|nr:unnamed protein product [Thlaspi arvense]
MAAKRKTKAGLGLLLHDDEYTTSLDAKIWPIRSCFHPHDDEAKEAKKETCVICFDDDIDPCYMFSVSKCGHRFCVNCVKKHIEVKLLDGTLPNCLEHGCESQLCIDRCRTFLTLKLIWMWEQRIREDTIPSKERVYCPNCSYLMSKTELFSFSGSAFRRCFKCSASFCFYCRVTWHSELSCTDYMKLHPSPQNVDDAKLESLANLKGWRQCHRCQHMVELSSGCIHITCR